MNELWVHFSSFHEFWFRIHLIFILLQKRCSSFIFIIFTMNSLFQFEVIISVKNGRIWFFLAKNVRLRRDFLQFHILCSYKIYMWCLFSARSSEKNLPKMLYLLKLISIFSKWIPSSFSWNVHSEINSFSKSIFTVISFFMFFEKKLFTFTY